MGIPLRALVVDDTAVYRKIVSELLKTIPGVEVVGTAPNGIIALRKIDECQADLVTLDVEMPELDGLGTLRALRERPRPVDVLMLSAFTAQGAVATVSALDLGAYDFVLKPTGSDLAANSRQLREDLAAKIEALARTRSFRRLLRTPATAPRKVSPPPATDDNQAVFRRLREIASPRVQRTRAVAIGISTGGPKALTDILPMLPADLGVPVLIVQHMPPLFTRSLAEDLDRRCALHVSEAVHGQLVLPNQILIAPGGKQMKIQRGEDVVRILITDDPPENSCRPSVDYLFRSVAEVYGGECVGVIMTGMGNDGAAACRLLHQRGASIVAQNQATCVVYGMPREPVEQGIADFVVGLTDIPETIVRLTGKGLARCG